MLTGTATMSPGTGASEKCPHGLPSLKDRHQGCEITVSMVWHSSHRVMLPPPTLSSSNAVNSLISLCSGGKRLCSLVRLLQKSHSDDRGGVASLKGSPRGTGRGEKPRLRPERATQQSSDQEHKPWLQSRQIDFEKRIVPFVKKRRHDNKYNNRIKLYLHIDFMHFPQVHMEATPPGLGATKEQVHAGAIAAR